jgi:hypothetical protein
MSRVFSFPIITSATSLHFKQKINKSKGKGRKQKGGRRRKKEKKGM